MLPGVGPGDQLFYFPLQAVIVCGKYDQAVLLRLALLRFRVLPPILRSVSARPLSTRHNRFCGGRHTHGIQRTANARSPSSATSCLASSRRPSVIASTCWCGSAGKLRLQRGVNSIPLGNGEACSRWAQTPSIGTLREPLTSGHGRRRAGVPTSSPPPRSRKIA